MATWEWGRFLGRGSYGSVYLAFEKGKDKPMAVKVFDLTGEMGQCQSLLREVKVMKKASGHPHVVHCHASMFDSRGKLCIVMEFMAGGNLSSLLKARNTLSESTAAICVRQVIEGVAHLHSLAIYHRDLKGENILVKSASSNIPQLKLADFGNSKMKAETISASLTAPTAAKTLAGTALWMAPEVIKAAQKAQEYSAQKADIWSLGIVACEILQKGKPPWGDFDNPVQALFTIGHWDGGDKGSALPPGSPTNISSSAKSFLKKTMSVNPADRPTAHQLRNHRWVSSATIPQPDPLTLADIGDVSINATSELLAVHDAKMLHDLCSSVSLSPVERATKSDPDFIRTATWTEAPPTEDSSEDESLLHEDEEDEEDEDQDESEESEELEEDEEDESDSDEGVHISAINGDLEGEIVEFVEVAQVQNNVCRNAERERQFSVPEISSPTCPVLGMAQPPLKHRKSVPAVGTITPITPPFRTRGSSVGSEVHASRLRPLPDDNFSEMSGSFSAGMVSPYGPSIRERRSVFEPNTPLGGASRASTNAISPTTPPPRSPGTSRSPGSVSNKVSFLARQFENI
eukprot:TRINITY_DN16790_c0_g2_i1.p1 TRINITY_DN16790_c0_g2~~TRINITY_DN16790_c0_g2_i1.p1  ORF type:complete len:587 (+),score=189.35 TRINITY_DN16790_c0_g2_i1:40-1761(+)